MFNTKDYNWMMSFTEKLLEIHHSITVNGKDESVFDGKDHHQFQGTFLVSSLDAIKEKTRYDLNGMEELRFAKFAAEYGD